MSRKIDFNIIFSIAVMLVTLGTTYGIAQGKLSEVDRIKDKVETNDKQIAVVQTKLDAIDESLTDQKQSVKEMRSDLKEILRAVAK